ncbi:tripartite motif-containing protein 16 [Astyanax mexicanus]|uniref:tripartite motif-containing protein 16 n=1 Tax=Astyanax mexicanus TaxID=7994 RepID=UPI0020CB24D5|nr:tripartite motif-containing protein 16 [Astyanax mexicanus]
MAEASISLDEENFNCCLCMHLLKDPVTLPCGHSYCMACINEFWDKQETFDCPLCRASFEPRPDLRRNNILTEVVQKLQQTHLQGSLYQCWDLSSSEGQDVECDSCVGEKKKAVKSCLTCLASFCDDHLQAHRESAAFKKHTLVAAFRNLQETTCTKHNKLLEVFCRNDQRLICSQCLLDKHKGHNTVSVQEEWEEKKKCLADLQRKYQNRQETREKILLQLKELMESFKHSTQAAVEESEKIFGELIQSIEKRRSEVTEMIRAREKAELYQARGLLEQLEKEIVEINKKHTDLDKLSHTKDYVELLQKSQVVYTDTETNDAIKIALNKEPPFEKFMTSVLELKKQMESFCEDGLKTIFKSVNYKFITDAEPETREDFLKYARVLSLDPNTVNNNLLLEECNTKVISDGMSHSYPDDPERFTYWQQVLCKQNVSQRSYWEVEVCGENGVSLAVSYKAIQRTGCEKDSRFGHNGESWRLVCYPSKYRFWENDNQIEISGPASKRIGIYLDEKAGTLSFYSVTNKMILIHKVKTRFSQPLYPGFGIGSDSYAKLCIYASSNDTGEISKKK